MAISRVFLPSVEEGANAYKLTSSAPVQKARPWRWSSEDRKPEASPNLFDCPSTSSRPPTLHLPTRRTGNTTTTITTAEVNRSMASGLIHPPPHPYHDDNMSMTNGYADDHDDDRSESSQQRAGSESPLSDVNDLPTTAASQVDDQTHQEASDDDAMQDMATSEVDEEDEGPEEQDADFDEETPPPDAENGMRHDESSSEEEVRSGTRRVAVDDEQYMKQNPELYGLRRSGRARPQHRVVETSDEDEDSDDVNPGRRRKRQKTTGTRPASTRTGNNSSMQPSSEDDSEEDDVYGGAKGRSFARKHRKQKQAASGTGTPQLGEVRFSTRQAAKVTNYNEEDDYGLSEEDTENVTPSTWVVEPTGPSVDTVLNHRLAEGVDDSNPTKKDYEYYSSYRSNGKANLTTTQPGNLGRHSRTARASAVSTTTSEKVILLELDMVHPETALEDREKWNLDRETYLDSLNEYMKVERVISAQDGDEDTEYYVKWKALPYDYCTWESASLVSELAQNEIDRYLDRTSKMPQTNQREATFATRSDYKPFRTQPDYIKGGQLREFQIHGLNFLAHHWCRGNNVILADEMGLGKTVQTVSFIDWLKHERGQQGPFIVVVPLSTMPAWADTFDNWTPDINYVVYNGNEEARKIIREYELLVDPRNYKKVKFNVLLTTYEYVLADAGFLSQLKWQFMAVDEAHRLKNRDSQLYAKLMEFGAPSRLLITGTPMQNTLSELSALMDFLMPGKVKVDEEIDLTSEHASQKIAELTNAISPYMIRRTKQKVEGDLPPKTEKIIRVELADVQLEYYKNILTRNYTALNAGGKGQKASLLNIMMELKKASNHAFMFPNAEERILEGTTGSREEQLKALVTSSGKMMLLDQLLTKMKKDGHRVLIFSQMVKMLDLLGDYLNLRGHQFQRLDGTIAAGARRVAIDHFNAPDSQDFCFLLSTRAGGLGINLMTADTVILFDSDWNPQADLQAMARAHRIGQKKPVTIYRLVSKDTVEEEVLERARNKLMLEFITIQRGVTDKDNTEMKEKLARAGELAIEPTSSDEISRILKKRGQKMFEQTNNQRKLEELDIEAVLENAEEHKTEQPEGMTTDGGEEFLRSFEYTDVKVDLEWDEIIPQAELEKIKEEERKKEEAAYLESVIEANQPRKRKAPVDEAREQRAAKKRARDLAAEAAADAASDDDDETDRGRDPRRPLGEKECRNLIRSYERFGAFEEKADDIVREARLLSRDIGVVRDTLQAVIDEADRLLKEESDRLIELERTTGKQVTKKERKTVLYDFRGVKRINAETIKERPIDMRMIRELVDQSKDPKNFRIPEASKPASYTCDWGAREDGMLTVGIARHGMGAWAAIRDDPDLDMGDKMFLEEHRVGQKEEREKSEVKTTKSPGAVHLVRRAGYLVSVLRDKTSGGANSQARRAMENHHRNNRKHGSFHDRFATPNGSASPAPGHHRKHQSDARKSLDRRGHNHSSPNGHRRISTEDRERIRARQAEQPRPGHHRVTSSPTTTGDFAKPLTELERKLQKTLSPISDILARAYGAQKKLIPEELTRLKVIKVTLLGIGNFISNHQGAQESPSLTKDLWDFVSNRHWPQSSKEDKRVSGKKLSDMYIKITGKAPAPKANDSRPAAKPESNGTPQVKKEAGEDHSPADKPKAHSPEAVKHEDKMDVDTKSPA
ncbi:hypothetical protein Q7P37_001257 [Cladosporium fusiforme]